MSKLLPSLIYSFIHPPNPEFFLSAGSKLGIVDTSVLRYSPSPHRASSPQRQTDERQPIPTQDLRSGEVVRDGFLGRWSLGRDLKDKVKEASALL